MQYGDMRLFVSPGAWGTLLSGNCEWSSIMRNPIAIIAAKTWPERIASVLLGIVVAAIALVFLRGVWM